nr:GNAT family N-acetyltransferase [Streptomyces zagrosensis]
MGRARMLAEFDRQLRESVPPDGPGARVERVGDVVRQTSTADGWNGVLWSRLDQHSADAAIAEQVRHFGALGHAFEWKLYAHDEPADLAKRLVAAGFTAEPAEALMVAEIGALPTDARLPDGVVLRPVRDAADVHLMAKVHEQAFGTDATRLGNRILEQLAAGTDAMAAFLVMAGDEPVCAARMEFYPGTDFAGLWGGGTVAAWRGRGIYRALIAHRARLAAERGYRYLQVDASDDSRPILARLGFTHLSTTTPYEYGS